jgi:hypothetical protein
MKMTTTTKFVALALVLAGTLLTVSVAYAASITMSSSSVMALGGTGQVTLNCPVTSCATGITSFTWSITGPPSAAPTVNGATATMTLAGTSSNHYTVYVTLFGSGATVLTSVSVSVAGAATSATVVIGGSISPSQIVSVEVDVVQTS